MVRTEYLLYGVYLPEHPGSAPASVIDGHLAERIKRGADSGKGHMTRADIIAAIEEEIERLERIRDLLYHSQSGRFTLNEVSGTQPQAKKRVLSAEARKRIAQAQKRRWAKQKRGSDASSDGK